MPLPIQMLLCILVVMAIPGINGSYYSYCPWVQGEISIPVFCANLNAIIDALPESAASTGSASLWFSVEPTPAFVHGFCFADHPSPQQCLGCLQSTLAEMKAKNCTYSWEVGMWGNSCFVGYSYTNTSTVTEDTFHALNFTGGDGVEYPKFFDRYDLSELAQSLVPSFNVSTSS